MTAAHVGPASVARSVLGVVPSLRVQNARAVPPRILRSMARATLLTTLRAPLAVAGRLVRAWEPAGRGGTTKICRN